MGWPWYGIIVWVWSRRVSDLLARSCGRDGAGFGIGEYLGIREGVRPLRYPAANFEAVVEPGYVSTVNCWQYRLSLPMGKHHDQAQSLADGELTPLVTHIQRNQMGDLLGQGWCDLPAHSQYAAFNRFLVSARYVSTTYNDIVHEERGVGAVRARVLGLPEVQRCVYPCWPDNMYHEIEGAVVVGEVGRLRDDVVDIFQIVYMSFGGVEGYDRSARARNCIFDLYGALVTISSKSGRVAYLAQAIFREAIGIYRKAELLEKTLRTLQHACIHHACGWGSVFEW